ncbi:MAG: M23 family metallopeptidase [Chloroflexota bacterium]
MFHLHPKFYRLHPVLPIRIRQQHHFRYTTCYDHGRPISGGEVGRLYGSIVDPKYISNIQWFGPTITAYNDHLNYKSAYDKAYADALDKGLSEAEAVKEAQAAGAANSWNYDGYCQGYHCGVDISADWGTPVYAGAYGVVIDAHKGYGGHQVVVQSGQYLFYYQGLDGNYHVEVGDTVTPYTVVAGVGNHKADSTLGNTHLHFEVRYSRSGVLTMDKVDRIVNPVLLMDRSYVAELRTIAQAKTTTYDNVHYQGYSNPAYTGPYAYVLPIARGGTVLWK